MLVHTPKYQGVPTDQIATFVTGEVRIEALGFDPPMAAIFSRYNQGAKKVIQEMCDNCVGMRPVRYLIKDKKARQMIKFFGGGGSYQKGLTIANARKSLARGMRSSIQQAAALGSRLPRMSSSVISSSRRSVGGADRRNSVKSRLNRHHVVEGVEPKEQACVVLYLNEESWVGSQGEMLADGASPASLSQPCPQFLALRA